MPMVIMLETLLPLLAVVAMSLDLRQGFSAVQGQVTDLGNHQSAHDDILDVRCELPEENSRISFVVSDDSLQPGTIISFACNGGLEYIGPATRLCGEDGKWHYAKGYEISYCAGALYYGPYEKIYNQRQCIAWSTLHTGFGGHSTHHACELMCDDDARCTAFNIKDDGQDSKCTLMECGSPQPKPMNLVSGWKSYSKEEIPEDSTGEVTNQQLKEKIEVGEKRRVPGYCDNSEAFGQPC